MICSSFSTLFRLLLVLVVVLLRSDNNNINTFVFVAARLEAAVILPHGDFALDPSLLPPNSAARRAAEEISQGARTVGHHWLDQVIDPDVIFLSTPHGIALTRDFGIYMGSTASGSVTLGSDLFNSSYNTVNKTVHLDTIQLAPHLSQQLLKELVVGKDQNVSGISFPDDSQDMPLYWAEVIPLLLLQNANNLNNATTTPTRRRRKHLIFSHPTRRHLEPAASMFQELLQLGMLLGGWMESQDERIAVVISADLSHTHEPTGPYGYSNASAAFDALIGQWASNIIPSCTSQSHDLMVLQRATELQGNALACGWTGFVLFQGMLCGASAASSSSATKTTSTTTSTSRWNAEVLVNRNATYYGMMAARFARMEEDTNKMVQPTTTTTTST